MIVAADAQRWETGIRHEYEARSRCYPDSALGWRLLYSPRSVLSGARVAFIGLNPGGRSADPAHGEFSSEAGSAYRKEIETWGPNSSLQDQVIALFQRLEVSPDEVLAGNLVPFRSPSENSLKDASAAIAFGKSLWAEIFKIVRPRIVVSMGGTANREVADLLAVQNIEKKLVGWGKCTATRGQFAGGTWIGLPHLSRFAIMKRHKSQPFLDSLFEKIL